jgi:hypothetical protein
VDCRSGSGPAFHLTERSDPILTVRPILGQPGLPALPVPLDTAGVVLPSVQYKYFQSRPSPSASSELRCSYWWGHRDLAVYRSAPRRIAGQVGSFPTDHGNPHERNYLIWGVPARGN